MFGGTEVLLVLAVRVHLDLVGVAIAVYWFHRVKAWVRALVYIYIYILVCCRGRGVIIPLGKHNPHARTNEREDDGASNNAITTLHT